MSSSHKVIFIFVDGIGLGASNLDENPLAASGFETLQRLAGGRRLTVEAGSVETSEHVFKGIDAGLGVEGLPQSGTGQATIFTGVNCARLAGRHYGPYPHSSSRSALAEGNLILQIERNRGAGACAFANAYPGRFFRYVERTDRWTVTTRCCLDAGVRLRTTEDLVRGDAITADITGERWPEPTPGLTIPISPIQAGATLASISSDYVFTLFEYWHSDKAGHAQDAEWARDCLQSVDGLLCGLLSEMSSEQTLVLTSDHGNIEDLSTRTHTNNHVPLIAWGAGAALLAGVTDLTGITPAVVKLCDLDRGDN